MNLIRRFLSHVLHHRELYLFPALAALVLSAAYGGVYLLTGRASVDQPDAITGWAQNFCGIILLSLLVGVIQEHLVGFRAKQAGAKLSDDIFDLCATVFFFSLFSHLLWH